MGSNSNLHVIVVQDSQVVLDEDLPKHHSPLTIRDVPRETKEAGVCPVVQIFSWYEVSFSWDLDKHRSRIMDFKVSIAPLNLNFYFC